MEVLGFTLAIVMGFTLGLIGGGGSILTVPILVYVLGVSASHATAYSLFIVGVSSFIASFDYKKRGLIDFKIGALFAVPAFIGVYSVRKFLMPAIPGEITTIGTWLLTKDSLILLVFSIVMLVAAASMIKGRKESQAIEKKDPTLLFVTIEGLLVGALTGFVGAGGGFMIIPALVLLAGLNMKIAIGTSLFIITIKSLIGFIGDIQNMPSIDWNLLTMFTALSILGIFLGTRFSRKVDSTTLKPAFGWFVLIMGTLMLVKETIL